MKPCLLVWMGRRVCLLDTAERLDEGQSDLLDPCPAFVCSDLKWIQLQPLCFFHMAGSWPSGTLEHGSFAYPLRMLYCWI